MPVIKMSEVSASCQDIDDLKTIEFPDFHKGYYTGLT